ARAASFLARARCRWPSWSRRCRNPCRSPSKPPAGTPLTSPPSSAPGALTGHSSRSWKRPRGGDTAIDGRPSAWRTVAAATALNPPLGTLYAFSVFTKPLEALLGLGRADLALVFALASAGFGVGMNMAPFVFGLAPTSVLVLACALASSLGTALAATAGGLS